MMLACLISFFFQLEREGRACQGTSAGNTGGQDASSALQSGHVTTTRPSEDRFFIREFFA
jgi:hypothetical protein